MSSCLLTDTDDVLAAIKERLEDVGECQMYSVVNTYPANRIRSPNIGLPLG